MNEDLVLEARGISKRYGDVVVLRGVDLDLKRNEVHAVVGSNGAGKSTLLKLLLGDIALSDGSIRWLDRPLTKVGSRISMVRQELSIVPGLSAVDNVFLGQWPSKNGAINHRKMIGDYTRLTKTLGLSSVLPATPAGDLSVAQQQGLEILRSMVAGRDVMFFDEPTASLGQDERLLFGEVLRKLKNEGKSILLVSHDLEEVLRLADRVTILRDGSLVETGPSCSYTKKELSRKMFGDTVSQIRRHRSASLAPMSLEVTELSVPGKIEKISFSVRRGEVFGIAGIIGSGRSELLRAIAGVDAVASGCIRTEAATGLPISVSRALSLGIALVPEERKRDGLILNWSANENLILPNFELVARYGVIMRSLAETLSLSLAQKVRLPKEKLADATYTLSGGNQQKVAVGKWMSTSLKVLLLDEPFRGIDLNAKTEIGEKIRKFASEGTSVVMVSSDVSDLIENCDRIAVLQNGGLTDTLDCDILSQDELLGELTRSMAATA